MRDIRTKAKKSLDQKFLFDKKRSEDMTCADDDQYNCQYGKWQEFKNTSFGGNAVGYGKRKFKDLKSAQKFGCDKGRDSQL